MLFSTEIYYQGCSYSAVSGMAAQVSRGKGVAKLKKKLFSALKF
jgi:hypothetical protein